MVLLSQVARTDSSGAVLGDFLCRRANANKAVLPTRHL